MDNGQRGQQSQNQFDGLTAGIGSSNEQLNPLPSEDNLNQNSFVNNRHSEQYNYSQIGDAALSNNSMATNNDNIVDMPSNTTKPKNRLGQIVDLNSSMTPTHDHADQSDSPDQVPDQDEEDLAIEAHFSDGKINKNDIPYIKSIENEHDPAKLVDFVMKARARMTKKEGKHE